MRMGRASSLRVPVIALIFALQAGVSQAQVPETFVRGDGDNAKSCNSYVDACRSVSRAVEAATLETNGVAQIISSAAQFSFRIERSLTIRALSSPFIIVRSSLADGGANHGIVVRPPSANDVVTIDGFGIDQMDTSARGLTFSSRGTLHLKNCSIRGTIGGIVFSPNGPGELHISDCTLSDNLGVSGGILIRPTGSGSANVVIDNVQLENNRFGITIDSTQTTGAVNVTIRNSTISGSSLVGVVANGSKAVLRIGNSTVTANPTGLGVANGGQIVSHGGNIVFSNGVNGNFTSTVVQQ